MRENEQRIPYNCENNNNITDTLTYYGIHLTSYVANIIQVF